MNTIATVFRKEMMDTIRDRRTLMFMIVIPLLLFPILFRVMFSVQKSHSDREKAKVLHVAIVDHGNAQRFRAIVAAHDDVVIVASIPADSVRSLVQRDSLDGAFVFSEDFDEEVAALGTGRVDFYYRSGGESEISRDRMRDLARSYEEELLSARFASLGLERDVDKPMDLRSHNLATVEEQIGRQVGGFLPYIFIIFCFIGAMYPAIDLGAGEKERGTMETLLTAPVNRFHILLGKFGVVVVSGLVSATVSVAGLYLAVKQAPELPEEFFELVVKILGLGNILLIFSLLVPLTVFFAGILLSLSLTARSFKEAQSIISPLNIAIIVPAAIGMIPGMTMSYTTAMIPVLNVSLATREIIAGTMRPEYLAVVYVSLVVYALASLAASALWFRRESTIFRA